jgi:acetylornithine deacetylase/succinyl-diaminopimelate desuccinylase-like protein
MATELIDRVLARADQEFPALVERLKELVRIPSCSFPGFDHAHVERSAEASVALLTACGFPAARVVRLPGVLPYVLASDHRAGPGAPTLLLYAHHDVQPPLREELWRSAPFEPVERDGRLYGRGAADDKAGVVLHAFSAKAWNDVAGKPPVNLTVILEGEEEVGSASIGRFLAAHREELSADALVIADLGNYDTGLPSLTTSLRGNVVVEVELRALRSPLHSGMWGGLVADPALALCRLLAGLSDADGRIAIDGFHDRVRPPDPRQLADFARLPYDPARLAAQAGAVRPSLPADSAEAFSRVWLRPSLTVTAVQSGVRGKTGNVIMDTAWARISVRTVPDQDGAAIERLLVAHLERHAPAGCELTVTARGDASPAWATRTDHPLFAVARAALERGYGVPPVTIGCGASIPFVGEMTAALGGIPALLLGVEDPTCGAHAENESVHLGDLRKGLRAQVALYGLMAAMPRG